MTAIQAVIPTERILALLLGHSIRQMRTAGIAPLAGHDEDVDHVHLT